MEVLVLSSPGCHNCKRVKVMLERIKKENLKLKIRIVDITKKPEILKKYPIMSAPGIVINGKLEFIGVPDEKKLREKLK